MSKRFYARGRGGYRPAPKPHDREDEISRAEQVPPRPKQRQGLAASRPKQITDDSFRPKHISTTQTNLKNDPHSKDSIVLDGYSGLVRAKALTFTNDYSQYTTITATLYAQISKGSKQFKQNVSLAMFEYYSTVLLWQRLYTVLSEREIDASIAEDYTKRIGRLLVPDELLRYLEGIGNIRDPDGRQAYLKLDAPLSVRIIRGMSGHYGRMNEDTHITYETQQSPYVVAYRMFYEYCRFSAPVRPGADLDEDDDEDEEPEDVWPVLWDLPDALSPGHAAVPNANLLGWRPISTGFSREMAAVIERYVDPDYEHGTFTVLGAIHAGGVPIFPDILDHVSQMLSVVKRGLEENNGRIIEGSGGSCSQVLYQIRVSDDVGHNDVQQHLVPVAERELLTSSYVDVGLQLSCAAAVFKYRIQRQFGNNSDCFAYTTARGRSLPHWGDQENRVFESQPRWNYMDLTGSRVSGKTAAIDLIFKTRKVDRIG